MCARGQNARLSPKLSLKLASAKRAKTSKLQKTKIVAILRLAKGFLASVKGRDQVSHLLRRMARHDHSVLATLPGQLSK